MSKEKIETCIADSLNQYFEDLEGAAPHNVYGMVMCHVERPLFAIVLEKAGGNQSKAAQWLGLSRNTLHKKLIELGLLHD